MPPELDITSYGHCYYALIIANLIKAGISKSGGELESCFNFAEHLAYQLYLKPSMEEEGFDEFTRDYRNTYIISEATLNRMKSDEYGIILRQGRFKTSFMYLFFLGRFLARNMELHKETIEGICTKVYRGWNDKILLFLIHHTNDEAIIEDIIIRTMCTLEDVAPATLNEEESRRFFDIIRQLQTHVVPREGVAEERRTRRRLRDDVEAEVGDGQTTGIAREEKDGEAESGTKAEQMYQVLRSNQLLGQILRNKYGALKKNRIAEIIETVADGGLRLINVFLSDEKEIEEKLNTLRAKLTKDDQEKIEKVVTATLFLWTMANVELIVHATNVPEVREAMEEVVERNGTPAYDLIGYFSLLARLIQRGQGLSVDFDRAGLSVRRRGGVGI